MYSIMSSEASCSRGMMSMIAPRMISGLTKAPLAYSNWLYLPCPPSTKAMPCTMAVPNTRMSVTRIANSGTATSKKMAVPAASILVCMPGIWAAMTSR
jgi:hypothetical protein